MYTKNVTSYVFKETAMELNELILRFSDTPVRQQKACFNLLFTLANRLQTLFDHAIPEVSLRQFMVLSVLRQSAEPMNLSEMGAILGCSRQNVKKVAALLEKKGLLEFCHQPGDARNLCLYATRQAELWFQEEFAPFEEELQILFSAFSAEEIRIFLQLLQKLMQGTYLLEQADRERHSAGAEAPKEKRTV